MCVKEEFQRHVGITVSEVIKGGSLGQGTQVKYKHDIDLVICCEREYI